MLDLLPASPTHVRARLDVGGMRCRCILAGTQKLAEELAMLHPQKRTELASQWHGHREEGLPCAIASQLTDVLLTPPGDATSKIAADEGGATMNDVHIELFFRCAMAVALMPTAALKSLARHHPDLLPHLAPPSASASERHRRLVQCVLPRFSMTCVTRAEQEANERRRAEMAAIKKQREEQREHDAAEEDGGVLL